MGNMLVRTRIAALAVYVLWLAWLPEAQAQSCRRSCKPGEKRDPRGCCIAESKPNETEKPAAPVNSTNSSDTKPAKPANPASSSGQKPSGNHSSGERPRPLKGSDGAGIRRVRGAGVAAYEQPEAAIEPQRDEPVQQSELPNKNLSVPQESGDSPGDHVVTKRRTTWKPWAVMGAGTAIVAVGGLLQWRASENITRYEQAIEDCEGCMPTDEERDSVSRGRLQWALARGAYVSGGVAIVTGIVLVMLNKTSFEDDGEPEFISIVPEFSPRGTSISMVLRY